MLQFTYNKIKIFKKIGYKIGCKLINFNKNKKLVAKSIAN